MRPFSECRYLYCCIRLLACLSSGVNVESDSLTLCEYARRVPDIVAAGIRASIRRALQYVCQLHVHGPTTWLHMDVSIRRAHEFECHVESRTESCLECLVEALRGLQGHKVLRSDV